ncbi:MAG TPA: hypothetical protein VNX68_13900 [Nitrosopumilaceae archaeon]|jgi:hypothetical protein|nr:hypothetical protein [Nitrosopumilaceae archaeon]
MINTIYNKNLSMKILNENGLRMLKEGEEGYGLLIEHDAGSLSIEMNPQLLKEGKFHFDSKNPFVNCILQKYGVENKNHRVYPEAILKGQVEIYGELVKINSAIGELNHPDASNIDLWNIPHRVVKMWWVDNALHGTLEIITSPAYNERGEVHMPGDYVMEYLKRGIRLGISSRGLGTLKKVNGKNIVQADYELVCFDLVFNPSTSGAYLYTKDQEKTQFSESENTNKPLIHLPQNQLITNNKIIVLDNFINKMTKKL